MFHKYRIRSIKEFCKNGVLDKNASESFAKKVAGYWLIEKRLQHSCFLVEWAKCFKNTYFRYVPYIQNQKYQGVLQKWCS